MSKKAKADAAFALRMGGIYFFLRYMIFRVYDKGGAEDLAELAQEKEDKKTAASDGGGSQKKKKAWGK